MKDLYTMVGISKQSHLGAMKRQVRQQDRFLLLEASLSEERQLHPAMSLKKIYHKLKPDFAGRDAFVHFGMNNGYEPFLPPKFHKTTHSAPQNAYPNLLHGAILYDINQVWVSDIFYYKIGDQFCYVVLIKDLYSRKILGFNAADNMFAQANLCALQMALLSRGLAHHDHQLIHHSDKGSQYRSLLYTQALIEAGIRISMGNSCYDNAFMESANRIVKREYLVHRPIQTPKDLLIHLQKDVLLYNNQRPHGSLNNMTPDEFERYIINIPLSQRKALPIYTDKSKRNNLLIVQPDIHQFKLPFPNF